MSAIGREWQTISRMLLSRSQYFSGFNSWIVIERFNAQQSTSVEKPFHKPCFSPLCCHSISTTLTEMVLEETGMCFTLDQPIGITTNNQIPRTSPFTANENQNPNAARRDQGPFVLHALL